MADKLRTKSYNVYGTCEPTEAPIGSIIHQIMTGRIKADERVVASLFAADRLDHLLNETDGIIKKKEEGKIVISDRYYFSSYAYHSDQVPFDWLQSINSLSAELLKPDIVFFLDVEPATCMERIQCSGRDIQRYEDLKKLIFIQERYNMAFDKLRDEENIVIINGNRSTEEIEKEIFTIVEGNLSK